MLSRPESGERETRKTTAGEGVVGECGSGESKNRKDTPREVASTTQEAGMVFILHSASSWFNKGSRYIVFSVFVVHGGGYGRGGLFFVSVSVQESEQPHSE